MPYALDMAISNEFTKIGKAVQALRARGIDAEAVPTPESALRRLHELMPPGGKVMTGASATLREIGLEAELASGANSWVWLRSAIMAEDDPVKRRQLRGQALLADFFLCSVQAVTETGQIVLASGSGSQLASSAYSSPNVVWVVGAQKIVPTLDDALRRIREVCVPKVADMAEGMGKPELGVLAKVLIVEKEMAYTDRKIHLIFVEQSLGF
jgi:hypothetical protein